MADETKKKPDAVLSDGREIYVDTTKITRGEWKEYVKSTNADDDDEANAIGEAIIALRNERSGYLLPHYELTNVVPVS